MLTRICWVIIRIVLLFFDTSSFAVYTSILITVANRFLPLSQNCSFTVYSIWWECTSMCAVLLQCDLVKSLVPSFRVTWWYVCLFVQMANSAIPAHFERLITINKGSDALGEYMFFFLLLVVALILWYYLVWHRKNILPVKFFSTTKPVQFVW